MSDYKRLKEKLEAIILFTDLPFEEDLTAVDCKQMYDILCKIEQGKLIELPCKVGDTVYHYSQIFGAIFPYFVESLNIGCIGKDQTYWNYEANYHNEETDELIDGIDFCPDDIGKTVFLTREEAEKRLKELQE